LAEIFTVEWSGRDSWEEVHYIKLGALCVYSDKIQPISKVENWVDFCVMKRPGPQDSGCPDAVKTSDPRLGLQMAMSVPGSFHTHLRNGVEDLQENSMDLGSLLNLELPGTPSLGENLVTL
jgi:hypothetical protein